MIDKKFYEAKTHDELIHLQKMGIERLNIIKEILTKTGEKNE